MSTSFPVTQVFICSGCGYRTNEESNMQKHRKKVCKDADVVRKKMPVVIWVESEREEDAQKVAQAIRAAGVMPGLHKPAPEAQAVGEPTNDADPPLHLDRLIVYQCDACGSHDTHWTNMISHMFKKVCTGTRLIKRSVRVLAWTDDDESARPPPCR